MSIYKSKANLYFLVLLICFHLPINIFASTYVELKLNSKEAKKIKLKIDINQDENNRYKISLQLKSTTYSKWNIDSIVMVEGRVKEQTMAALLFLNLIKLKTQKYQ